MLAVGAAGCGGHDGFRLGAWQQLSYYVGRQYTSRHDYGSGYDYGSSGHGPGDGPGWGGLAQRPRLTDGRGQWCC